MKRKQEIIDDKVLSEIESDYLKWQEYLNIGFGIVGFSLAISCLGTKDPQFWAIVSLAFMVIFLIYGKKNFPERIKLLRKAELEGIEELKYLGLEKKYFGFKALVTKFPLYMIAAVFLSMISLGFIKQ